MSHSSGGNVQGVQGNVQGQTDDLEHLQTLVAQDLQRFLFKVFKVKTIFLL
jgi:hypothetical protein